MDLKLSKAQMSKIIQSVKCLGKTLDNIIGTLGKKALLDLAAPLAKDVLSKLATKATSYLLDRFKRKISGKGAIRSGKRFTLFISNENMDDSTKTVE